MNCKYKITIDGGTVFSFAIKDTKITEYTRLEFDTYIRNDTDVQSIVDLLERMEIITTGDTKEVYYKNAKCMINSIKDFIDRPVSDRSCSVYYLDSSITVWSTIRS